MTEEMHFKMNNGVALLQDKDDSSSVWRPPRRPFHNILIGHLDTMAAHQTPDRCVTGSILIRDDYSSVCVPQVYR